MVYVINALYISNNFIRGHFNAVLCLSTYNRISFFNISWSGSAEHCFPMFITKKHYVIMNKR